MAEVPAAAVFDVGRVIARWDMRLLFAKLIADPDELDWFCANVVTEAWHAQHDAGCPIDAMIAERVRQFPHYAREIEAYRDRWMETIPGRVPGTAELIERLDARDIPLFAITNFGVDFWALYRPTEPLLDRFRDIVVSGAVGMVKPDAAIFHLAAARFGLAPVEMLFIDDSGANVAAAQRMGWRTHHFRDAAGLEIELIGAGLIG